MKKLQSVLCLSILALIFLVPNLGQCKAVSNVKQVPTKFGSIGLPKNVHVAEYIYIDALDGANTDVIQKDMMRALHFFNIYQLMAPNGDNYNNAYLVSMFVDNSELEKMGFKGKDISFFSGGAKILPDDKHALLLMQDHAKMYLEKMSAQYKEHYNTEKLHIITFKEKNEVLWNASGIIAVDWPEIQGIYVNDQVGYRSNFRFAGSFGGIVTSFYVNAYVFNVKDDGIAMVFLYTHDSERTFWAEVLDKSLKENVTFDVKSAVNK